MRARTLHDLQSRVRGSLVLGAGGDALGAPGENASTSEILAGTGGKGVTGFEGLQCITPAGYEPREVRIGQTTDDTQLTWALCRSLIRYQRFDLLDIMREHERAMKNDEFGWGGTTLDRVRLVTQWFESGGRAGEDPRTPATSLSHGSGVAMKIAPLGLYHACHGTGQVPLDEVLSLGRATHGATEASAHAYLVASLVRLAAVARTGDLDLMITGLLVALQHLMSQRRLHRLTGIQEFVQGMEGRFIENKKFLYCDWNKLHAVLGVDPANTSADTSVPVAMACALRHLKDPRAAICEAVNLGGDTDTAASMAGAIVGASCGIEAIPEDLRKGCEGTAEALRLADELVAAAE